MTEIDGQRTNLTSGDFTTESLAWDHFDKLVAATEAFNVYTEVEGEYLHPRVGTQDKAARIDRLLVPRPKACISGWNSGIIGVEGKRSGMKVGKLICQAIDYTRCIFRLKSPIPNLLVMPTWVFIYPMERIHGDLESVMVQNRIGTIGHGRYGLAFQCSAIHVLEIGLSGGISSRNSPALIGNKRGSR